MKSCLLLIVTALLSVGGSAQECTTDDFASFSDIRNTVSLLLSQSVYTGFDEKALNRSGDLAAVAISKTVPNSAMESPEKIRQILVILRMAFQVPQVISACGNRKPVVSLLLLDHLQSLSSGAQLQNEIANTRAEIQRKTSTDRAPDVPFVPTREIDWEHSKWFDSVMRSIAVIKPGMTRKDLLNVFKVEGGLSTRTHRQYVLKECPYIKVDVDFVPVGDKDQFTETPDDTIVKLSPPYLQYAIFD